MATAKKIEDKTKNPSPPCTAACRWTMIKVMSLIPYQSKTDLEYQIIPNKREPIISGGGMAAGAGTEGTPPQANSYRQAEPVFRLVYCPDCGAKLHFCAAKSLKPNQEFFRCANYKGGRGSRSIHYIRNVVLEQLVLEAISDLAGFVRCYEPVFLYMLAKKKQCS